MEVLSFSYIVAAWFLFILVLDEESRPSATILFLCFFINIIMIDVFDTLKGIGFIGERLEFIKYDGAFALLMTMVMVMDKSAKIQAKILCLTIACHSMISLYLVTNSTTIKLLSFLFYEYYEELLILTALLHMVVSKDGMVRSLYRFFNIVQNLFDRFVCCCRYTHEYSLQRKTRESKK